MKQATLRARQCKKRLIIAAFFAPFRRPGAMTSFRLPADFIIA